MAAVNTVLGPIKPGELGATLTHEHILISSAGTRYTYPELIDREAIIKMASTDLAIAREEGVDTIVDVTTMDMGRDVTLLENISYASGVHIICATGSWLDIPRDLASLSEDTIAKLWIREIEKGIESSSIKAGIIKIATSSPIKPQEELMLRAAAKTHQYTGVPITTHTQPLSTIGLQQLTILEEHIQLEQVCIGHLNHVLDMDYHSELADKGTFLGMDSYFWGPKMESVVLTGMETTFHQCGNREAPGLIERTNFLKRLIDNGYKDRIMLSHDWVTAPFGLPSWYPSRKDNPDGYLRINREVIPQLRKMGVSSQDVELITVGNPKRFFDGPNSNN